MSITLITATVPERPLLFAELATSVACQTTPPDRWLVEWDHARRGPVAVLNELAGQVETEWLFRSDDDDLLDDRHFATLAPHLTADADVVYTWCRVEGFLDPANYQCPFDPILLREGNFIPSAAAVRTSLWHHLGGLNEGHHYEDWDLWLRALDAGAQFVCVPEVTWTYRLGNWDHRSI